MGDIQAARRSHKPPKKLMRDTPTDKKMISQSFSFFQCKGCSLKDVKHFIIRNQTSALLTMSMPTGPFWESSSRSASEEISCLTRNPKLHYYAQRRAPLDPNLSQINPVCTLTSYLFKVHSMIHLGDNGPTSRKPCTAHKNPLGTPRSILTL
jgi:hypothetical protein